MKNIKPVKLDLSTADSLNYLIPNYRASQKSIETKDASKYYNKKLEKKLTQQRNQIVQLLLEDSHYSDLRKQKENYDRITTIAIATIFILMGTILISPLLFNGFIMPIIAKFSPNQILFSILLLIGTPAGVIGYIDYINNKRSINIVNHLVSIYSLIEDSNLIDGIIDIPNSKYMSYASILLSSKETIQIQFLIRDFLLIENENNNKNIGLLHKEISKLYDTINSISNDPIAKKARKLNIELPIMYTKTIELFFSKDYDIIANIDQLHQITNKIVQEKDPDTKETMISNLTDESNATHTLVENLTAMIKTYTKYMQSTFIYERVNNKNKRAEKFEDLVKNLK